MNDVYRIDKRYNCQVFYKGLYTIFTGYYTDFLVYSLSLQCLLT